MKTIKTAAYTQAQAQFMDPANMGTNDWEYKGYKCRISMDKGVDNKKAEHEVITPDGQHVVAPISPYDTNRATVNLWIDLGMPEGHWNLEQLRIFARKVWQLDHPNQGPTGEPDIPQWKEDDRQFDPFRR